MAEFAYNNLKNASTSYTSFKLNSEYHPCVSYEENLDPHSKLKFAEELSFKLQNLMAIYQQNLYHAEKFQNQSHSKDVKRLSYVLGNKF